MQQEHRDALRRQRCRKATEHSHTGYFMRKDSCSATGQELPRTTGWRPRSTTWQQLPCTSLWRAVGLEWLRRGTRAVGVRAIETRHTGREYRSPESARNPKNVLSLALKPCRKPGRTDDLALIRLGSLR